MDEVREDPSQPMTPPGACALRAEPADCSSTVASEPDPDAGSVALPGDCVWVESARLSCPSLVSRIALTRGSGGQLDALVAQKGLDGRNETAGLETDERAHLSLLRLNGDVADVRQLEPVEDGRNASFTLLGGGEAADSAYVVHESPQADAPQLIFRDVLSDDVVSQLDSPGDPGFSPYGVSTLAGHAAFADFSPASPLFVLDVRGTPSVIRLPVSASAAALDLAADGTPRVLVHDRTQLLLLAGNSLSDAQWSRAAREGSNLPAVDLLYGLDDAPNRFVALYRDGSSDPFSVVTAEGDDVQAAQVSHPRSGCGGFSINFSCDDCPVGTQCENQEENHLDARLFVRDARVFVAYFAVDERETRVTDTDVSPFGVCVCDTELVDTAGVADYLVVKEVRGGFGDTPLELVEVLRLGVGGGYDLGYYGLSRDARRELDVFYGPARARLDTNLAAFPQANVEYLILHFGAP